MRFYMLWDLYDCDGVTMELEISVDGKHWIEVCTYKDHDKIKFDNFWNLYTYYRFKVYK